MLLIFIKPILIRTRAAVTNLRGQEGVLVTQIVPLAQLVNIVSTVAQEELAGFVRLHLKIMSEETKVQVQITLLKK